MSTESPKVPGEGVSIYVKNDNSRAATRLMNYTHIIGLRNVTFHNWDESLDAFLGLESIIDGPADEPQLLVDDFRVARDIIARNKRIEALTFYRRGEVDKYFINASDEDLHALGEEMSQ